MATVTVYNSQQDLLIQPDEVERLVQALLFYKKISCEEIVLHFVSIDAIALLHEEHFGDPSETDCITFPMDSPDETPCLLLGEIFVCPKMAIMQGGELGIDPYEESTLYIVHGFLHLLGFGDIEEGERMVMRYEEERAMKYLRDQNLFLRYTEPVRA